MSKAKIEANLLNELIKLIQKEEDGKIYDKHEIIAWLNRNLIAVLQSL